MQKNGGTTFYLAADVSDFLGQNQMMSLSHFMNVQSWILEKDQVENPMGVLAAG